MLCVNLMDEAAAAGITIDLRRLEAELGVPVVGISAARKQGLEILQERLRAVCDGFECPHPKRLGLTASKTPREAERNVRRLVERAEQIASSGAASGNMRARTQRLDRVLSGKVSGPLLMALLLFGVLWLTISGANPISERLESCFMALNVQLWELWRGAALAGMARRPVFGWNVRNNSKSSRCDAPTGCNFLPIVYNIRRIRISSARRVSAGCADVPAPAPAARQALTMCMGCGCNAVGVTGCRIIGSERERLLAILTNSFVPCNGRFPLLIALGTFLFAGRGGSFESAVCLNGVFTIVGLDDVRSECGAQPDGAARRAVGLRDGSCRPTGGRGCSR